MGVFLRFSLIAIDTDRYLGVNCNVEYVLKENLENTILNYIKRARKNMNLANSKIFEIMIISMYFSEFSLQNILHYFCYVLRAFNTEKALRYEALNCPLSFQDHEIFLIRIIKKA